MDREEAIKRVKALNLNSKDMEALSTLVPEIVESEDERIRKELISFVEQAIDAGYGIISKERKEKWIAWLEKQGRLMKALQISNARIGELIEKNYYLKEQFEKQGDKTEPIEGFNTEFEKQVSCLIASAINREHEYNQGYVKWTANALLNYAKHELEKQREYNMGISEATKQKLEDSLNKALEKETPESCNEFLDEQKPVDKVEPKFHEGDWTVSNLDGKTRQISEVHFDEYNSYYVVDGKSVNLEEYDRLHHPWIIQDAKDGDVLATDSWLYMFKYTNNKALIQFHCKCPINGKTYKWSFLSDDSYLDIYIDANIHPATKEQHDILFQKMKEAGYEWDAEKKELKKIEEEEYNGEDYGIDSLYHAQRILEKTLGKVDGYQSDDGILEHKCAITAIKELYAQGRYTWKPSDEQMDALDYYANSLCTYCDRQDDLRSLFNDLKRLREE